MRNFQQWMDEYGVSHQNPTNQAVHKICVPAIMFSVLGMLWTIPFPLETPWFVNWASVVVVAALLFYLSLNALMFVGMLVQASLMLWLCHWVHETTGQLLWISIAVFVIAWIGQFWGHKIEGKKPSFLQDLVFLLIGPLWVQRFLYARLGLKV